LRKTSRRPQFAGGKQGSPGKARNLGNRLTNRPSIVSDGAALGGVLNYFASHQDRLNYALRLRRGQSIGSGLVEGSIKQLLNKRLKQTGARWKVEHVGPFVKLGALPAFWEN
jgi:hypothetical protein